MNKSKLLLLTVVLSIIFSVPAYGGEHVETAPDGCSFKPYMSYEKITNKSSHQYLLQQFATTDIWGLRKLDGRYMIAVGTHYCAKMGTKIDIVLDNGKVLNCVLADSKADKDTDATHRVGAHNDIIEFIVDMEALHERAKYHGDISSIVEFEGEIEKVIVHDTVSYLPL